MLFLIMPIMMLIINKINYLKARQSVTKIHFKEIKKHTKIFQYYIYTQTFSYFELLSNKLKILRNKISMSVFICNQTNYANKNHV